MCFPKITLHVTLGVRFMTKSTVRFIILSFICFILSFYLTQWDKHIIQLRALKDILSVFLSSMSVCPNCSSAGTLPTCALHPRKFLFFKYDFRTLLLVWAFLTCLEFWTFHTRCKSTDVCWPVAPNCPSRLIFAVAGSGLRNRLKNSSTLHFHNPSDQHFLFTSPGVFLIALLSCFHLNVVILLAYSIWSTPVVLEFLLKINGFDLSWLDSMGAFSN